MSTEAVETGRFEPDRAGRYADPIGGSPVIADETPYSEALRCMAPYTAQHPLRIAVGKIADETSGNTVTQGGALMAISALAKAGVPQVERFDTSIAELERRYVSNGVRGGQMPRGSFANLIPGSDYYLVGGITELNFNLYSEGANIAPGSGAYVMNIGLDLRLVDSKSLEVADVVSYQKQIVGYRQLGFIEFLGYRFRAGSGASAEEPIQLAVRSVIERAVLEMVSRLYRAPAHSCGSAIDTAADPLAGPDDRIAIASPRTASAEAMASNQISNRQRPKSRGLYRHRKLSAEPRLRRSLD